MCSPNKRKLCDDENCQICFERSFANHPKSEFWSLRNTKTPRQVFMRSIYHKYLFECNECRHEFKGRPAMICRGDWCPFCATKGGILCKDKECKHCFKKSFAFHEKSKYWSLKNEVSARDVFISTNNKYIFDCPCGHEIIQSPNNIVCSDKWCPYCCKPSNILCNNRNCASCFERSFASHEKSKYWSPKNQVTPRDVSVATDNKYIFICEKEHEFSISPMTVSCHYGWCQFCVNKTETLLYSELVNLGYDVKYQPRFDWCRSTITGYLLPFDFVIEEYKIIIELDGIQHFKQVCNWKSPEEQQKRDLYKMGLANVNGYTVIRILQEDVWKNRYDWLEKIEEHLYIHKVPTRTFISSGEEYKCFT